MRAGKSVVRRAGVIGLCAGAALAASSARAAQVTANWLAPVSGSWTDPTKWSGGQFPNNGNPAGTTYHAVIGAVGADYTVSLNSSVTLDELMLNSANATLAHSGGALTLNAASVVMAGLYAFSGGSLTGSGEASFTSSLHWTGGTMSGSGRTVIGAGGALSMSGGAKDLNRHLENDGEANWTGGSWRFSDGVFQNDASFTANSGGVLDSYGSSGGSGSVFVNNGSFTKQGAGEARFAVFNISGVAFDNHGTVDVREGMLALDAGGSHTGDFVVASGALLRFKGTHVTSSGVSITGAGDLSVNFGVFTLNGSLNIGGTATFSGGSAVFNSAARIGDLAITGGAARFNAPLVVDSGRVSITDGSLNYGSNALAFDHGVLMNSGTLSGSGSVSFAASLDWTQGTMSGSGRTVIGSEGTLVMSLNATKSLRSTLENDGEAIWTEGIFQITSGIFQNDGTFTANSASTLNSYGAFGGEGSAFINNGVFSKQGAGEARFWDSSSGVAFDNYGAVDVQMGTLGLEAGGVHTGDFAIAAGALLRFNGSHTASVGASLTGAGNMQVIGGGLTHNGTTALGGTAIFSGGTANFNGAASLGGLTISGGTANFNAALTLDAASDLLMTGGTFNYGVSSIAFEGGAMSSSGTLTGSGDALFTSSLNWNSGTMSGSGRTVIGAGGTLSMMSTGFKNLHRTLENDGDATWTDGQIRFNSGVFQNDGTFTAHSQSTLGSHALTGSGNAFVNNGLFTKQGAGEARFFIFGASVAFENRGVVDVQEGTLTLAGSATTTNNGSYKAAHNARIAVTGEFLNASGAALSFEVGGMKERGLSGLMTITGEASLAGTLSVETPEAFSATWGDRWVVMTYGSVEGDFDVFDLPTEGFASRSDDFGASDLRWYAERGEAEYAVGVSHIADIDHDGLIGFGDLNVIASNFNAFGSWAQGDVDGDGFVGFTDLNAVLSLFNVAAPRSVPGPGAAVVLVMAAGAMARRRGR